MLGALLASMAFWSCQERAQFTRFKDEGVKHNVIVLARHGDEIRLLGLKGALPANVKVNLKIDEEEISTTSLSEGNFDLRMKNEKHSQTKTGNITFELPGDKKSFTYAIRDLDTAVSNVVGKKLPYSGDITDFNVNSDDELSLSAGHTASFHRFRLNSHWADFVSTVNETMLNPSLKTNPALRNHLELQDHFVVSLFSSNSLALIAKKDGKMLHTTTLKNPDDSPYIVSVGEILTTTVKQDVMNDGQMVSSFDKTIAFGPDALFALDDTKFLATFTNYYEAASNKVRNAVVGPGILGLFEVRDGKIQTLKVIALAHKNPQYFFGFLRNSIWLLNTGAWEYDAKRYITQNAGLTKLSIINNFTDIIIDKNIAIDDFSCGKPTLVNDHIIIPESFGERVFVLSANAVSQTEGDFVTPPKKNTHKFLEAEHWRDNIIFLSDASGSLVAFDSVEGFFPFPFVAPLTVLKDIAPSIYTPRKILFRQGDQGFDYTGNNGLIMLLQKQIVTFNFLVLFGP